MITASIFLFKWSNVPTALAAPGILISLVGLFYVSTMRKISPEAWKSLGILCTATFAVAIFGVSVWAAKAHADSVRTSAFENQVKHDLRLEGFKNFVVDPYGKTVTITIGKFGCLFTFSLDRPWPDGLWRPVMNGTSTITLYGTPAKIPSEAVFEASNFKSLKSACS